MSIRVTITGDQAATADNPKGVLLEARVNASPAEAAAPLTYAANQLRKRSPASDRRRSADRT